MCVCVCVCVHSCVTVCDSMDNSLPGSSVHGISQEKLLRVGCHFLLQGIFPTQGSNPRLLCLLHWQAGSLPLASPFQLPNISLYSMESRPGVAHLQGRGIHVQSELSILEFWIIPSFLSSKSDRHLHSGAPGSLMLPYSMKEAPGRSLAPSFLLSPILQFFFFFL